MVDIERCVVLKVTRAKNTSIQNTMYACLKSLVKYLSFYMIFVLKLQFMMFSKYNICLFRIPRQQTYRFSFLNFFFFFPIFCNEILLGLFYVQKYIYKGSIVKIQQLKDIFLRYNNTLPMPQKKPSFIFPGQRKQNKKINLHNKSIQESIQKNKKDTIMTHKHIQHIYGMLFLFYNF